MTIKPIVKPIRGPVFNVDWLSVVQQFPIGMYPDFYDGRTLKLQGAAGMERMSFVDEETGEDVDAFLITDSDGLDYDVRCFSLHRGSYETTLRIRLVAGRLEVSGNPSSYGRLDNVFGVSLDQAIDIYNSVLESLGLPVFSVGEERRMWLQGEQKFVTEYTGVRITRVDYCTNLSTGTGNIIPFHQWLARQKLYRSSSKDETLDKVSQKWNFSTVPLSESTTWINVKAYDKADQIENVLIPEYEKKLKKAVKEGHLSRQQADLLYNEANEYLINLACWCAEVGLSRVEYSLKNRWFNQHDGMGHWKPIETETELLEFVGQEFEKIGTRMGKVYQVDSMDSLTNTEFAMVQVWKSGQDVKTSGRVGKSQFYNLRKSILKKTGYDIAARPVGLTSTIEMRPVYFQMKPLAVADSPSWYRRAA